MSGCVKLKEVHNFYVKTILMPLLCMLSKIP